MEWVPIHSVKFKHDDQHMQTYILRDETTARRLGIPTIVAVAESKCKTSDCHKGRVVSKTSKSNAQPQSGGMPPIKEKERKKRQVLAINQTVYTRSGNI